MQAPDEAALRADDIDYYVFSQQSSYESIKLRLRWLTK